MPEWTEESMQSALLAVQNGLEPAAASKQYGIPRSTLRGRLRGANTLKQSAADRQMLSPVQEADLATWVKIQERLGQAPSHFQIRRAAELILQQAGITTSLGKNWTTNFMRRNTCINTFQGKRLENKRAKAVTPDNIKELFEVLKLPLLANIRAQHRYNMDETGVAEGVGTNGKHVGAAGKPGAKKKRWVYVKGRQTRTWMSILECVNAEGNCLPPVVVFTGKSVQQQWFPQNDEELQEYVSWNFTATENGWTCNDIGYEWLTKHFIPLTNPGGKEWRLLIMDGHNSHVSDEFMSTCAANRVFFCCLPAHTSHVTQPLDVAVFSPLKSGYRKHLEQFGYEDLGSAASKQTFLYCYHRARKEALTARNIRAGWKTTGLWPVDISKALNSPWVTKEAAPPLKEPAKTTPLKRKASICLPTPRGGGELLKHFNNGRGKSTRDTRMVVRKAAKSIDQKNTELALLQMEKKALERQLEDLRPKKRVKVVPEKNKLFAQIKDVKKAQAIAIAREKSKPRATAKGVISLRGTCLNL
jgi:4-hydroxybenzoate polyprenyltransferase